MLLWYMVVLITPFFPTQFVEPSMFHELLLPAFDVSAAPAVACCAVKYCMEL